MKKQHSLLCTLLGTLLLVAQQASALVPYFGPEQYGTSLISRTALDTQATTWIGGLSDHVFSDFTFDGIGSLTNPHSITLSDGSTVAVSVRDFTWSNLGTLTSALPNLSSSSTLQDGSPRPLSNPFVQYWTENIGATTSKNALLFDFSEPFASFGAWFGDIETRQDGSGADARYYLLDASQSILYQWVLPTSTPLASQTWCGWWTNGCGNKWSRWIGFDNDTNANVKYLLVVVGDDDWIVGSNGYLEHLSIYGWKVGKVYPDSWVTKSATGSYKSGDSVTRTITFGNSGSLDANNVLLKDLWWAWNSIIPYTLWSWTLAAWSSQTMTVTGWVYGISWDSVKNTVTIETSDEEISTGNNIATGTVSIIDPVADVEVIKTVDKLSAQSWDSVTYNIVYRNNGPDTAENVIVSDTLPAWFTYLSHDTWTLIGNLLQLTLTTLNAWVQGLIVVTWTVFGLSWDQIINTATIETTTLETNTGNNSSSGSTNIVVLCASDSWSICSSSANACGIISTGIVQCDGSCSAVVPSNPGSLGSVCSSAANACGMTSTGTIQCDGSCSAVVPSNPGSLGSVCSSAANACGMVTTGTIQCDGSCTATVVPSIRQCPSGWGGGSSYLSCGNGVIDKPIGEECDDGNINSLDGCSSLCKIEQTTLIQPITENQITQTVKKMKQLLLSYDQTFDQNNKEIVEHFISPTLLPETGVNTK